ncbi:hypothetical protein FEM48_Zijuj09G0102800 [Ziziphus jujuba var. spinosa]|uniref:CCHC-type domain-containing protein n=1 Tax=Ziziphus jujuba var. spinosa TaxID=714518 RepID=A0A978USF1_ZIZJJ|nr:hypothetical protein FEM48_Zijuj09G0102800 [Ziziphus jujuba var. spinosa]
MTLIHADELAFLGKPVDDEDLIDRKLLNKEASLQTTQSSSLFLPATANPTAFQNRTNWRSPSNIPPHPGPNNALSPHAQHQSKPYPGRCQACGIQGHTTKRCPMFRLVTTQQIPASHPQGSPGFRSSTPRQPHANHATLNNNITPTWLLDSEASHHVTFHLSNLSLHSPYQGSDDVMIGDESFRPVYTTRCLNVKIHANELALLGKPVDDEDLIDRVLLKDLKLLNKEASLQTTQSSSLFLPATANPTAFQNCTNWRSPSNIPPHPGPNNALSPHAQHQSKPYPGRCQACGIQGHTTKRCPMFRLVTTQQIPTSHPQGSPGFRSSTPWQPHANHATLNNNITPTWLLGSEASHHVTSNLSMTSSDP